MNIQELIERIKDLSSHNARGKVWIDRRFVLDLIKQLDEPQKPVVPQFVVEWINSVKKHGKKQKNSFGFNEEITADDSVYRVMYYIFKEEFATDAVRDWVINNKDTFARAWLDGYEVEEEKRYYVRFKFIEDSYSYLTLIKHLNAWTLSSIKLDKKFRSEHTKKQLEEAGFGWIFSCEGIEVEEVE